ncbi:sigma-70 family RNA polymerase sigma factor [Gracilibacillus salitolerans]|uniref:Sigma-70 family RNA polymerase sigma factor n=1 Tax=Gracilibacillus salitolerans TaxID=2663022 RepID=A0A5Q2TF37_9BACI|nr:RNA polymerase sigma factor [Gracilibacillus salitolerans]QGH32807.1 sigma-70 family RNA polymerase sigma factor [Gracilibacillus salitolerans]
MHLHDIGIEARKLYASFIQSVDEFRPALWRYCLHLTSNVWDAEDLMQETLMKTFVSLGQIRHPFIPKSYLFRIASNTWIDQRRKIQPIETNHFPESIEMKDPQHDYSLHVLEGIEILISSLTPRHVVVVLLSDVFDFSAQEVADMLQTTEGAVHAMLSRARANLKSNDPDGHTRKRKSSSMTERNLPLLSQYVQAFHLKDTAMLMDLYAQHGEIQFLNTGIVRGRNSIESTMNWSSYPESFHTEWRWLWGEPVVLFIADRGNRQTLWRAQILDFEEGKVVKDKNYFFCREVMLEIAEYLQLPIDPDTQAHYEQPWKYSVSCPIGINSK